MQMMVRHLSAKAKTTLRSNSELDRDGSLSLKGNPQGLKNTLVDGVEKPSVGDTSGLTARGENRRREINLPLSMVVLYVD